MPPALAALVVALGGGGAPGCLPIEGGAIELSWVLYCANGRQPGSAGATESCNQRATSLARVQLVLTGVSDGSATDGCSGKAGCSFVATDQSANTGFYVPPGDYDMSLVPLDGSGQPLGGPSCVPDGSAGSCWQTPAPIRRTVLNGEVVSLGSLLVAVPDCPSLPGLKPSTGCPETP